MKLNLSVLWCFFNGFDLRFRILTFFVYPFFERIEY
jgi:hypothetical protein